MTTAGAPVSLVGVRSGAPIPLVGIDTLGPAPGGGGARFTTYQHSQTVPATVWIVHHGLGRYPAAVSLFSADFGVEYDEFAVQHLDVNSLRISMDLPSTGRALIM